MAEVSVAIADDNRQTLNLLGEILEKEDGIHVVGKADNGEDAYNMIVETNPDIVLMECDHAETGWDFRDGAGQEQQPDEGNSFFHYGNGCQQPGCDRGRVPSGSQLLHNEAVQPGRGAG